MDEFQEMMKFNEDEYQFAREVLKDSALVERRMTPGYGHTQYYLAYSPIPERVKELSAIHGALLADHGNLCFGGRNYSKTIENGKLVFTGTYHTD